MSLAQTPKYPIRILPVKTLLILSTVFSSFCFQVTSASHSQLSFSSHTPSFFSSFFHSLLFLQASFIFQPYFSLLPPSFQVFFLSPFVLTHFIVYSLSSLCLSLSLSLFPHGMARSMIGLRLTQLRQRQRRIPRMPCYIHPSRLTAPVTNKDDYLAQLLLYLATCENQRTTGKTQRRRFSLLRLCHPQVS